MFLSHEVISRFMLVIMTIAMLGSTFIAKPQFSQLISPSLVDYHQHDRDTNEPTNGHDPLVFHSHGNVHHLNADHSHDLNKLFTLTSLAIWKGDLHVFFANRTDQLKFIPASTPERPPRSLLV
ncbi:hypothetical protein LF934_17230 [Dickeya dadantii]|uniref:hypothetical protein n=1 Tax=Dickeya dadantii TaxID=204038 RepID=UPI001CF194B0|nr:hypothetical protein [Dickeya dadantii]MCA7014378.1 hypothetical protein [Dickeya dadantii]